MPFPRKVKEDALVKSRRCCCVCHEFVGLYTSVHHIQQEADGGANVLDNAIVLCLRCHGEAGHYNIRHPIGDKYSPSELYRHRDEWWRWCSNNPYSPLPKAPIEISPWQIKLSTGQWRTRSVVRVYNKSDVLLHQIHLKFFSDSVQVEIKEIKIEPKVLRQETNVDDVIPGITVNTNLIRIDGIDENGNKATYLLIDCIHPKEVLSFTLIDENQSHSYSLAQPFIIITVQKYEHESSQTLLTDARGRLSIKFEPAETFGIQSTRLFMKRS